MDANSPAFPSENDHQSGQHTFHTSGLTQRNLVAAMFMQGLLSNPQIFNPETLLADQHNRVDSRAMAAKTSFMLADAFIAEANKEKP